MVGYHETLTQARMHLIHLILRQFGSSASADAFVDTHSELLYKRVLLLYYSRDRIMAAEAKHLFLQPDLKPFGVCPSASID